MPKELFNQPLVETPNEPDINERFAFGSPSVSAGKNITYGYLKQLFTSVSLFDATIGITGTYADIAEAQTELILLYPAKTKFKLKAVDNIIVSGDTTLTKNIYVDLDEYTMDCGTYSFYSISHQLKIENGEIEFANPTAEKLFGILSADNIIINNCIISNYSTIDNYRIADDITVTNSEINLPNYGNCGFGKPTNEGTLKLEKLKINGGGILCYNAIFLTTYGDDTFMNNIDFASTFKPNAYIAFLQYCNNIRFSTLSISLIVVKDGFDVSDLKATPSISLSIGTTLNIGRFKDLSSASQPNSKISNVYFHNDISIDYAKGELLDCTFNANVVIGGASDGTILRGKLLTAAKTLTFTAGVDDCYVILYVLTSDDPATGLNASIVLNANTTNRILTNKF